MRFICECLTDGHDLSSFDSSELSLDEWLRKSARNSDGRNITRTYIWHAGDSIALAYYTLMPYFIEKETLSRRQARGLPDRIPCYLVARLALGRGLQGQGFGSRLLASALQRAALGARDLGGRFVVVDALSPAAASFYRHHGFEPIPGRPDRLVIPTKVLDPYLPL